MIAVCVVVIVVVGRGFGLVLVSCLDKDRFCNEYNKNDLVETI